MLINLYAKSSSYSRAALTAAIALIVLIGSYNWLIAPHVQYLEAAQKYADEVGRFTSKSKVLEGKLKIKQIEIERLSEQVCEKKKQFFTPAGAQQFLSSLEMFANEANCIITSLNQHYDELDTEKAKALAAAGIRANRAAVSLTGGYPSILKFLAKLLDRPNAILINSLSISVRPDNSANLDCSLTLTIYVIEDTNITGADPNE
jgi:hypothetical protein